MSLDKHRVPSDVRARARKAGATGRYDWYAGRLSAKTSTRSADTAKPDLQAVAKAYKRQRRQDRTRSVSGVAQAVSRLVRPRHAN